MKHIIIITIGLLFFSSVSFSQTTSLFQQQESPATAEKGTLFSKGTSSGDRSSLRVAGNIFNPGDPMPGTGGTVPPNPGDPFPTPVGNSGVVALSLCLGIYGMVLYSRRRQEKTNN